MTPHNWQRTKIVCTLGPATDLPGVIEQLIEYGMDVARVNASHGDHADHARRIERVRSAAHALGQPVAILIDLPGPKFRIGDLPDDFRKLTEGTIVRLAAEGSIAGEGGIAEEYNTFCRCETRSCFTRSVQENRCFWLMARLSCASKPRAPPTSSVK